MKETLTMIPLLTLRNPMILQVYINESINSNESARLPSRNWMVPGTQIIFFLAVKGIIFFKL